MTDPRVPLKNPWIAGVLGFLVPGLGHLYQGRYFKSLVYFCCIVGMFVTGMQMADWKAMYVHRPGKEVAKGKNHALQFLAQAGVGLPAIVALIQNKRYYSPDNVESRSLDAPLRASFRGRFRQAGGLEDVRLEGIVELEPTVGRFGDSVTGRFVGTDEQGREVQLELGERMRLEEPVNASRSRDLDVGVVETDGDSKREVGELTGEIPRRFLDWFVAPVTSNQESKLHRELGKFYELAMVFTWVAGLLNILAVWDALEGPAYGYGDEDSEQQPGNQHRDSSNVAGAKPSRAAARVGA